LVGINSSSAVIDWTGRKGILPVRKTAAIRDIGKPDTFYFHGYVFLILMLEMKLPKHDCEVSEQPKYSQRCFCELDAALDDSRQTK